MDLKNVKRIPLCKSNLSGLEGCWGILIYIPPIGPNKFKIGLSEIIVDEELRLVVRVGSIRNFRVTQFF